MTRRGYGRADSHPISLFEISKIGSCSYRSSRVSYFYDEGGGQQQQSIRPRLITSNPMSREIFDQYLTFCPKIITRLIDRREMIATGCCMLADISGFTKLSSNLCKDGPSGIDALRIVINHSFASYVDIIHQFGGDVIAFAGDSLLCFFPKSNDDPSDSNGCCLRAIQCGLQISQCHIEGTTTHVGITYGEVCFSLLGRKDNYVVVMNGQLLDDIAVCLENANSQEVVVSSSCYSQVCDNNPFKFQSLGFRSSGDMRLECYVLVSVSSQLLSSQDFILQSLSNDGDLIPNQFHFDMMHAVIPPPVIQAASTGSFSHLSEIRTVTTLFLKLDSYSTKRFPRLSSLNPIFSAMMDCLVACGGMLRQFLIDDKGCVLIALWGVPTANHSNNSCMAVRCSVMMRTRATELNETVSIGITTGSVYCGIVGGTMRRDYVAIGHPVNLSARLMGKANGMILLDHVTHQKLPLVLMPHLSEVTGLKMKGIDQSAHYYQYDSLILPSERLRDVREEQMVMIDHYIKRKRLEIFELLNLIAEPSTAGFHRSSTSATNMELSSTAGRLPMEDCEDSTESLPVSPNHTPSAHPRSPILHSHVLIIEGGSGSGKTTTLNYFIRKIWDALNKTGKRIVLPKSGLKSSFSSTYHTPNLTPLLSFDENSTVTPIVFISLLPSADNKPYDVIRSIFETLFKKTTSTINYHKLLKYFLIKSFPNLSTNEIAAKIFPFLQEILHLAITLDEFLKLSASFHENGEISCESLTPSSINFQPIPLLSKLLAVALDFYQVVVLAIEDAHFMCQDSWQILSYLCQNSSSHPVNPTCFVFMTMRKDSSRHVASSHPVIKLAKTKSEKSVASLSHVSSRMTTQSAQRLSRGYRSFVSKVRPGILPLRPMPTSTIKTILEKHKSLSNLSSEMISTISDISHGNPSIIWKIINHLQEERDVQFESILRSMRDNTLILSLLKACTHLQLVILKTASVIGEEFSIKVLKLVLPESIYPFVDEAMEVFSDTGFLINLDVGFYGFSSSLLRKMIYDIIPKSDSILIHAEIARAIKRLNADEQSAHIFSLVYHYAISLSEPGHQQLAFESSCESVQKCLEICDLQMAAVFIEFAETVCTRREDYRLLSSLIQQAIDIHSISSSPQVLEQLDLLTQELHRIRSKTSFTSIISRKFHESWNSLLSKISLPKISPSD